MYITVSEAAERFNISKRRVQVLCEQGRIEGANRVNGTWLIPACSSKPNDGRKKISGSVNQISIFDDSSNVHNNKLTAIQVCDLLSISQATLRNWIRLGKLKTDSDNETFDKQYIDNLLNEIKSGNNNRLKSRRNKKNISGKSLYKDYIKSECNREVVDGILRACKYITNEELRVVLAHFAIQIYQQSCGVKIPGNILSDIRLNLLPNNTFKSLIWDLLGNIDISRIDKTNIQYALNCRVNFTPGEDTLGFVYISLRDISLRKQMGAYYTSDKTVNELIDSLNSCLDIANITIFDPCCGTGNFLLGLIERGAQATNIFGQDIDEISILITRINMFILDNSLTKEQLYSQFICGNTLFNTYSRKFTVVLGNPPWGYAFNKEEIEYLANNYVTAKNKSMESYDLFVEKGLSMLEDGGYLAYVLPEAILNVSSHQSVREIILNNASFRFVSYLGNVFSGVQCPAVILGLQDSNQGKTKNCKVKQNKKEFLISTNRMVDSSSFSLNMDDDEYDCLLAISSVKNAKYLANNAKFALGIVTGDNKKYIQDTKSDGMEVVLKGSDIYKYVVHSSNNYICYTPKNFQQVAPTEIYRAREKLLYRFIADVPVFAYDSQQRLSLNSCNILIPQLEGMDIKYVLAILNSSVAAYFISKKYNSVKLLRSHIESLPIPMVSKERQDEIIKKVDLLLNSVRNTKDLYEGLDNEIMDIYSLSEKHKATIHASLAGKNLFIHK